MPYPVTIDNWVLIQGESVSRLYSFTNSNGTPFDLTGYTAQCQFRRSASDIAVLWTPELTIIEPATLGQILLSMLDEETFLLDGTFVYDIKIFNSSGTQALRIVSGSVSVSPAVTRDN